jgi:Flp pilus assembly protein TadB
MDPFYAIPAFIVFTVVGIAVLFRIATSPIRGARHVYNAVNPNVKLGDKKDSKEILKDSGTRGSSYLGFLFSCFIAILVFFLVSLLHLPYILNLILGICGAALLYFSFNYFQNRLP